MGLHLRPHLPWPILTRLLNGGIPVGSVTELSGESASGKTQLSLHLLLLSLLPLHLHPHRLPFPPPSPPSSSSCSTPTPPLRHISPPPQSLCSSTTLPHPPSPPASSPAPRSSPAPSSSATTTSSSPTLPSCPSPSSSPPRPSSTPPTPLMTSSLQPLKPHHIRTLLKRAVDDLENGLHLTTKLPVSVDDEALQFLSLHPSPACSSPSPLPCSSPSCHLLPFLPPPTPPPRAPLLPKPLPHPRRPSSPTISPPGF